MHNNYFFLKALTSELNAKLGQFYVNQIYSQHKEELIIEFCHDGNNSIFNIKAHLAPEFSCLHFPENFQRARKNSIDLFEEAIGKKVASIDMVPFDRSFTISLTDGYTLLFKLHGNRGNIALLHNGLVIKIFKNNLKNDWNSTPESLRNDTIDLSEQHFNELNGDIPSFAPIFGPIPKQYLLAHGYGHLDLHSQWQLTKSCIEQLGHPVRSYVAFQGHKPILSLLCLPELEHKEFDSPIEAINFFFITYIRDYQLEKSKDDIIRTLTEKIKKGERYIHKCEQKYNELEQGPNPRELADLLMANLHNQQPKAKEITVDNFYTGDKTTIKLKENLSLQKNAEYYYRKSKNQKLELENLLLNIERKETQINEWKQEIEEIQQQKDIKLLKKKGKQHTSADDEELPYHEFIYQSHRILVGKNAKKNDVLTFKHATKDDLWLHVKDSPGSHVIIKNIPGQNFGKSLIEYAASIAAYYSKRKTESVCPVSYTPRKYVRKKKWAAPGQVIVEREQVVLVKPYTPH